MPQSYDIFNGQEILVGTKPAITDSLDLGQYAEYSTAQFDIPYATHTQIPLIDRVSGGLIAPVNNTIRLEKGLYIVRFPQFANTYFLAKNLNLIFRVRNSNTNDVIAEMSFNQGAIGFLQIQSPVLMFILNDTTTIEFLIYQINLENTVAEFSLDTFPSVAPIQKFLLIKLDKANTENSVDTVDYLLPNEGNVTTTHYYDTLEHYNSGYTWADAQGNNHVEPAGNTLPDNVTIIKQWENPVTENLDELNIHPELWTKNTEVDLGKGLYGYWWKATVPLEWLYTEGARKYTNVVPAPFQAKELIECKEFSETTFLGQDRFQIRNVYNANYIGGIQVQVMSVSNNIMNYSPPSTLNVDIWYKYIK